MMRRPGAPQRVVCLTEEPTEVLYALGLQDRIVGISGFTVRPTQARREKPKVSAFLDAKIERIIELKPDLVIGFSDLQADIAQQLIRQGLEVWIANHRSIEGIRAYILRLGCMMGESNAARRHLRELDRGLNEFAKQAKALRAPRPRVYFEEWDEPLFTAIQWVDELISLCGGDNVFGAQARAGLGRARIIADPQQVIDADPQILFASWCGKKFRPQTVQKRPGWSAIRALRDGQLHEIPASEILQPGPAALSDGARQLFRVIHAWRNKFLHKRA
jgi:iron complex transport system substrate-binding protein